VRELPSPAGIVGGRGPIGVLINGMAADAPSFTCHAKRTDREGEHRSNTRAGTDIHFQAQANGSRVCKLL